MAGTFNQSLQCTQDVFVDFQAPLPPVKACVQGYSDLFPPFFHSLLFFLALELSQHMVAVSQLASSKSIVFPLCYEAVDFV